MPDLPQDVPPVDYVLVHGAWHGAWCWRRVADRLIRRGGRVFAPTLSGLADRSHLAGRGIDLQTHVDDVVGLLKWEGLKNAVLCGHSYGGFVISGAAEQAPAGAIGSIVFLDAFLPEDGRSWLDYYRVAMRGRGPMQEEGEATGLVSPIPAAAFAVNAADRAWVDAQCTPQPYGTLTQALKLAGGLQRIPRKAYVLATGHPRGSFEGFAAKVRHDPAWRYYEVPSGHDVMLDAPARLVEILEEMSPRS